MNRSIVFVVALGACSYQLEALPPVANGVSPELVCNDQRTTTVTLSGSALTPLPTRTLEDSPELLLPEVYLRRVMALDGTPVDDEVIDLATLTRWLAASTMEFDVTPELALVPGIYDVGATNPDGQQSIASAALAVAPPPRALGVAPSLESVAQAEQAVLITGEGFLVASDGSLPAVTVGTWTGEPTSADGCTDNVAPAGGQTCTSLSVTLPIDAEVPGVHDITVQNPPPADCSSTEPLPIELVPAPVVLSVDPTGLCTDATAPVELVVSGTGFLDLAEPPILTVGDTTLAPLTLGGCAALELGGGQTCTSLTTSIEPGVFIVEADLAVVVQNPQTGEAVSNADVVVSVTGPPVLLSVDPNPICVGAELTIFGDNLYADSTVLIGGVAATVVGTVDGGILVEVPLSLTAGFHDITVTNPGGCSDTLFGVIEVVEVPLIVFVDPPVAYNGVSIEATVYISGIHGDVIDATIVEVDTGVVTSVVYTYDPAKPSRVKVVLPDGLPEGDYQVVIIDEAYCVSELDDAFYAEADLTIDIDRVELPFAYTGDYSSVNIYATDPPGSGLVQFVDVPRAYLNPTGTSTTATELYSIELESAMQLDAVVPQGLDVDVYDLIIINPDGAVGLLADAIEVTAVPLPEIDGVSPLTADSNSDTALTVSGANLDDPTVEFTCVDPDTGTETTHTGTVTAWATDELTVTMPSASDGLSGTVCTLLVTNADGTYATFASVSVTPPSDNLFGWQAGSSLTTPRRAPAAVAGRATKSTRYLYVLGGDSGTAAKALGTMERARVDSYGELSAFGAFKRELPEARTLASVRSIGRFIYIVGGHDGTSQVDTVLRAQVLDPVETPRVSDITVAFGDGTNLVGGTWIYKIAALYDSAYATNPGGESLVGNPFVMRLPDLGIDFTVALQWTQIDNASGYRIYRSPAADAGSGNEEWVADVSGGTTLTWTDTGDATDSTVVPLPKGSLGEWYEIGAMASARQSPCTAIGLDPDDDTIAYLYVAGGLDDAGNVLDDIEYLDLSLVDDQTQTIGSWTTSAETLARGVYECGGYSVTSILHPIVSSGETWVYFVGGLTDTAGTVTGISQGGQVTAGGELGSYGLVDTLRPVRAGFGYAAASNYLYVFGGKRAEPDGTGASGAISGPPDLDNWNSLGISMTEDRYLPGSAQESSVIFVVGGESDTVAATDTVDWTNY